MLHAAFDLFTSHERKISCSQDKYLCDITMELTFRTDNKIPVKCIEIVLKNKNQLSFWWSTFWG